MPAAAIPAATIILLRDVAGGVPQVLVVERATTLAFAGGAVVFPGGRVDPGDRALAATIDGDPDETAARIAAIRETIEEAGIAVGVLPRPDAATITAMRTMLHDGRTLGEVLAETGTTLDLEALTPFARWLPDHATARVFDARFYLAHAPAGTVDPVVDGTENVRAEWTTAQTVLNAADAGTARIIFPTRRNLERLATYPDAAAAHADAVRYPPRTITPWIEHRDGTAFLCIPDDLGYPVTAEPLDAAMRG